MTMTPPKASAPQANALQPCPFCGGCTLSSYVRYSEPDEYGYFGCKCGVSGPSAKIGKIGGHREWAGVEKVWNRRAASAQVREVEASGDDEKWSQQYRCGCFLGFPTRKAIPGHCPHHLRDKQGPALHFPPAPEPVPVAQDIERFHVRAYGDAEFEMLAYPDGDYVLFADHARRVAELEADNERLKGAFDDHDETASVHWYMEWVDAKRRADGLEASLAACRADAERLDYIERTFSGMTNRERYLPVQMIWGKGAMGRSLREACDKYMKRDALRQEPT